MTSFNYRDVVVKTTTLISENEIRQIIKKCKFDNVSVASSDTEAGLRQDHVM
jgi:hypothetical protein